MKASKFLITSAAALSVVGVIGLAYAQTTTEGSTGATQPPISETNPSASPSAPAGPGLTPTPAPATAVQPAAPETTAPQAAPQSTPQSTPSTLPSSTSPSAPNAMPMDSAAPPVERAPQADRN